MTRRKLFKGFTALLAAPFLSKLAKTKETEEQRIIRQTAEEIGWRAGISYKRLIEELASSENRVREATGKCEF